MWNSSLKVAYVTKVLQVLQVVVVASMWGTCRSNQLSTHPNWFYLFISRISVLSSLLWAIVWDLISNTYMYVKSIFSTYKQEIWGESHLAVACGYVTGFNMAFHMAMQPWGKFEGCDWFFLGRDFAIWAISMETVISWVLFVCFWKSGKIPKFAAKNKCHIINYLLTEVCSSHYWGNTGSSVVFCMGLAALGPYCHDLRPIFSSTALALS